MSDQETVFDKILAGDTVIMMTLAEVSKEVEALF